MVTSENIFSYPNIKNVFNKQSLKNDKFTICTNSKNEKVGDCFIAIVGEVHDGFKFIKNLNSTKFCVYQSSPEKDEQASKISNMTLVAVDSIEKFIFHLCHEHSKRCYEAGVKTVAISGSNGKTTTKEMLKHFLEEINEPFIATLKNDNNHFGVPFTMLRANPEIHKVIVLEYGSNHPGEMEQLCNITYPSLGVTTNIGYTHMEFFDELEDVFKEESRIFHRIYGLTEGTGLFLINNDDQFLRKLSSKGSKTFGVKKAEIVYKVEKNKVSFNEVVLQNESIIGDYNFINLANAYQLAVAIFSDKHEDLKNSAHSYKSSNNRSEWLDWNNKRVFLDAYNANPSSMQVAIKSYMDHVDPLNTVLILGQMNELGKNSEKYHFEFGEYVSKFNVEVIYVGQYFEQFSDGMKRNVKHFNQVTGIDWKEELSNYKNIFAKASRSLQLESIFDITEH